MKKLLSALAISGVCLATIAQASTTKFTQTQPAKVAMAKVTSGTNAYVMRNGRLLRLTSNMSLMNGDRLITRPRGFAKVAFNGNCRVALGSSSMLPITATSCAKRLVVSLDQGRAGYYGASSGQEAPPTDGSTGGGSTGGGVGGGAGGGVGGGIGGGLGAGLGGTLGAVAAIGATVAGVTVAATTSSSDTSPTSP